jgi:hypothetical protein
MTQKNPNPVTTWLSVLGLIFFLCVVFAGCNAVFFPASKAQQAYDECIKSFIAKNLLTPAALESCKSLEAKIERGQ